MLEPPLGSVQLAYAIAVALLFLSQMYSLSQRACTAMLVAKNLICTVKVRGRQHGGTTLFAILPLLRLNYLAHLTQVLKTFVHQKPWLMRNGCGFT